MNPDAKEHQGTQNNINQLQEKLNFLREQLIIVSDPIQKFTLIKQIKKTEEELAAAKKGIQGDYKVFYSKRQILLEAISQQIHSEKVISKNELTFIQLDFQLNNEYTDIAPALEKTNVSSPKKEILKGSIKEIFDELDRKILILGESGAGKTTVLEKIASDLMEEAEENQDNPIPILLNLSTWGNQIISKKRRASQDKNDNLKIKDWVIQEIKAKYYSTQDEFLKNLLNNNQLIFLLDGLDEVKEERRKDCIKEINDFSKEFPLSLVITCRIKEYEEIAKDTKLERLRAIVALPLTKINVKAHLKQHNALGLLRAFNKDESLQELLIIPLWLDLALHAYHNSDNKTQWGKNPYGVKQKILKDYVDYNLNTKGRNYKKEEVLNYLHHLSKFLQSSYVFHPNFIQPTFLTTKQQITYQMLIRVTTRTLLGLPWFSFYPNLSKYVAVWIAINAIIPMLSYYFNYVISKLLKNKKKNLKILEIRFGQFILLLSFLWHSPFGLIFSYIFIFEYTLHIVSLSFNAFANLFKYNYRSRIFNQYIVSELKFQWSWLSIWREISLSIKSGDILISVIPLLIYVFSEGNTKTLIEGFFSLIIFPSLFFYLLLASSDLIQIKKLDIKVFAKHGLIGALIVAISGMVFFQFWLEIADNFHGKIQNIDIIFFSLRVKIYIFLISNLSIFVFLCLGGANYIRYLVLKFISYLMKYMPWKYSKFIKNCYKMRFLKKVGDEYAFYHNELEFYFLFKEYEFDIDD